VEKISLKLADFYQLDTELNGIINQKTGEKIVDGLLSEKLKLTTKYWLTELAKKVSAEKSAIESLREDLIKKYGEANKDGRLGISMYLDIVKDKEGNIANSKLNPKFIEFQNDFNILLQETKELEYKPVSFNELENIESNNNYPVFFQLIKVNA
jgi:deoxyhypusine synthase